MSLLEDVDFRTFFLIIKRDYQHVRKISDILPFFERVDDECPSIFDVNTEKGDQRRTQLLTALEERDYDTLKLLRDMCKLLWQDHRAKNKGLYTRR